MLGFVFRTMSRSSISFTMMSRTTGSSFPRHIYERRTSSIAHPSRNIWISGLIDPKKTCMEARKLLYSGRVEEMRSYEIYEAKRRKRMFTQSDLDKKADLQIVYSYTTWKDTKIKIIDTDNTVDFTVSAQKALCDLDGAILVISGTNGVESAIKVNGFMEGLKVPRFLLIDELDKKGANPWEVLEKARLLLGLNCAAIQAPIGLDCDFKGVVDLVKLKAYFFHGDTINIGEIPTDMEALVSDKRQELIETLSKVDDTFAITSDGDNNPSSIDLEDSIRRGIIAQKFIPVFMGSILEKGPHTLLDGVLCYFPCSEVTKYGLDQYKNMEAASLVQVARKNIVVRSRPVHLREYTDIFSCSTVEGESHVYVLPTQHDTEASRSDAKAMVEYIRPQLLFLELDVFRSQSLEEDYNVNAVAFQAAKFIGNIEFDLGDLDQCSDLVACRLKKTEDLCRIDKITSREKLEKIAKDMVHIDIRNLIMTYRLYKHAQKYSSVLAVVGRNHMFGMRHYWNIMKKNLSQDGIFKEAESFEECMRRMKLDYNSQPPLWLDSKISLWDRYPDIE